MMSYEPTQANLEEKWLQERLEMVQEVKHELRGILQEGRIKDKRLQKLLLKALQIVHMYEVELGDRLDELSTTASQSRQSFVPVLYETQA